MTSFMLDHRHHRDRESAKAMVTAVRALLRFLHVAGQVPLGLAAEVPGLAVGVAAAWARCGGGGPTAGVL
jgi:hypothetical protein